MSTNRSSERRIALHEDPRLRVEISPTMVFAPASDAAATSTGRANGRWRLPLPRRRRGRGRRPAHSQPGVPCGRDAACGVAGCEHQPVPFETLLHAVHDLRCLRPIDSATVRRRRLTRPAVPPLLLPSGLVLAVLFFVEVRKPRPLELGRRSGPARYCLSLLRLWVKRSD
eukprot:scaffold9668_cov35-Tisochrysis_lutea.AAC.1